MPIKNSGRQTRLVAVVDLEYTDLPTGVAVDCVRLPPGAVVVGGGIKNVTASNAATSDTLTVGNAVGASEYLSGHNGKTANAYGLLTVPGVGKELAAGDDVTVTRTEVGAATAGTYRLVVEYVVADRVSEVQQG